jgi:outer membrane protein OmpA-like peptidoglycan-associated protein
MLTNRTSIIGISIILIFSGCMTKDPYTREDKSSNTSTGAIFGAFAGAILGAAVSSKNDRRKGLLRGAGIGAIAGGSVGNYMDKQEAQLRQKLEHSGVSVTRDGDNIILNMPSNITFDIDRFEIKSRFIATLDSVVLVLKQYPSTLVTTVGHTDSTGSQAYNQQLSEQRAVSVSRFIVDNGIKRQRLAAIGNGELQPIAGNDSAEGRAMNRRVEITLEPITQ